MNQIKVELQEWLGSDKSIADAAWTSSTTLRGKMKRTEEDVKRVVNMLADSGHSTPFESVVFRFWIKLPIQTDRQHMTHRIASHNGMSGRYRTMPNEWLKVPREMYDLIIRAVGIQAVDEYESKCEEVNEWYNFYLKIAKDSENHGVISNKEYKRFREFFRGVLPQNNMTERVTIMNLRSFANYQKLRNNEHAQPEIQMIAKLMLDSVEKSNVCPIAIEALKRNNWII